MIKRALYAQTLKYLISFPITALLGPRQCGKSTFAKDIIDQNKDSWVYLDLERPSDLRKLNDPELYFTTTDDKSVCIDGVQLRPDLFPVLRSIVDSSSRTGQILLLGSASPELLRQGSETLAGRISFLELTPFTLSEVVNSVNYKEIWSKGGYPRSTLANDEISFIWRENFIKTYVERDLISLGFKLTPASITRLLTMCAHTQGQLLNISKLSQSMGVSRITLTNWIDILLQTFILRKLEPLEANVKKRLVKSSKIYIRDSGLLHTLLDIESFDNLMGNPIFGSSWEGFAIESILTEKPKWKGYFYRTFNGAEVDLILTKGTNKIAIEFKTSLSPKVTSGFWNAIADINPDSTWIVIPEGDRYQLKKDIWVISLKDFLQTDLG